MKNKVYALIYPFIWLFMKIFHPWKVIGEENIPEGAVLICGNHTTLGDPIYVVMALGANRQTHAMAKNEIVEWPIVGWILKKAGIFGVKRGQADVSAVKEALRVLKSGERLLMFPEGTRVREGEVSEAHAGAAMFSTRTGAPILPVYIQKKKRHFRPTTVVFGEPYHPEFEGKKPSPDRLKEIANDLMDRIRALGEGIE